MASLTPLMPRQSVPPLSVSTVDGGRWTLSESSATSFTMVVFYRGHHCPICAKYLRELERVLDEFAARGVDVIAVSGDVEERARRAKEDWRLTRLRIGHGLDLDDARRWGLYISTGIGTTSSGVEEPVLFTEPAVYLVRPDGTLYYGSVQTSPFARPDFTQLLAAVDKALATDYPARGEVVDHHAVLAERDGAHHA
ncbi:MAG: AhpC/TSA family protein [Trueperaceae bacterium]|nr:AhpC/TSA family protein [Trueperaceae bacterium]